MKTRKWGYPDWLALFFVAGVLLGTGAARLFGPSVLREQGTAAALAAGSGSWELYWPVLRHRLLQTAAGWMMGMTICSAWLFCLAAAWAGIYAAVVLSLLTAGRGILGLPIFLCGLLHHGLFSGMVWWILAAWAGGEEKRTRLLPFLLLEAFTALGAGAQVWLAPLLTAWF